MSVVAEADVVSTHIRRLSELQQIKNPWLPLWQDITDYVLPRRSFWDLNDQSGQVPATKAYDGTAIADLQLLVDGMQGNMVSAAFPWLRLVMEDRRIQALPGVADYLELVEEIILAEYARTPFYEAMNEFLMDLGSIGTAVMLIEDDVRNQTINFQTKHMKECFIAENSQGMVNVLYRSFRLANRDIVAMFPEKVSDRRRELAKEQPFAKGNILHATFPSGEDGFDTSVEPREEFTGLYIDVDQKNELEEGWHPSFPYAVGRWRKNSDEWYGRSPAADAIQDILRVNQMAKDLLHVSHMASDPPLNIPKSIKGEERIVPHGFNYMPPNEQITTVDYRGTYPIGKDQQLQVRDQIHEIFRSKIFLLLEQLQRGPYTATEIRQRVAEQAAVMGAIISRLNKEVLFPTVRRSVQLLGIRGSLPQPPQGLRGRVKMELQGALAQAQRRLHQSQGVDAGLEFIERMAKLFPDGLDNVDQDQLYRIGMDAVSMPQRVIREMPAVEMIRKARADALARQAQAQQQAAEAQQLVSNISGLNEPLKQGSMLEQMAKQSAKTGAQPKSAPQGAVPGAA